MHLLHMSDYAMISNIESMDRALMPRFSKKAEENLTFCIYSIYSICCISLIFAELQSNNVKTNKPKQKYALTTSNFWSFHIFFLYFLFRL